MISYNQWMKETKRGLCTPRSSKLKAIDSALKQSSNSTNLTSELNARNSLITALISWLESKEGKWEESTRNSKGSVRTLIKDLSVDRESRNKLSKYLAQVSLANQSLGKRTIVFSGHGSWNSRKDGYVQLPAKCSMEFYTMNMRTLSDSLGGDIDRGIISGLVPDQENKPFGIIPNNRLYPPDGLNIRRPDPASWDVLYLPGPLPKNNKNIQIQIQNRKKYKGGANIKQIFEYLKPIINNSREITFLWAACRAIDLDVTGIDLPGVNKMQR